MTNQAPDYAEVDELQDVTIYLYSPLNDGEAATVRIYEHVKSRLKKLEVPFAHLDQFLNEKAKGKVEIFLRELQVTEEVAEKLMEIQLDEAPELTLIRADLSLIPNATLLRLVEKFKLCQINNAVLPNDLDAEAMLKKCKRNRAVLHITANGPIEDHFAFGIDALADYMHSSTHSLLIREDYIRGSWYSLYEKLRDDFLADPERRVYKLTVFRCSKTPRETARNWTIVKPATGERLTLNYAPSYRTVASQGVEYQYVQVERRPVDG